MSKNASKNASKTDNPQRFYLMLPPLEEAGDFPDRLADALDRADVACVLAPLVARDEGSAKKIVKALIAVTEPRGVALLIATDHKIEVVEATPSEMKRAIAGEGRATKAAVTKAITKLLALQTAPTPDDAADALALALWGAGARKMEHRSGSSRLDRSASAAVAAESGFDRAVRAALRAGRS
jgi:Holliday junction resolvasome RuvABC endonuclease subunit